MELLAYVAVILIVLTPCHVVSKPVISRRIDNKTLLRLLSEVERAEDAQTDSGTEEAGHDSHSNSKVRSDLEELLTAALKELRKTSSLPETTKQKGFEPPPQTLDGGFAARMVANDDGDAVQGVTQELRQEAIRRVDRAFRSCFGHGGIGGINRLCELHRERPASHTGMRDLYNFLTSMKA